MNALTQAKIIRFIDCNEDGILVFDDDRASKELNVDKQKAIQLFEQYTEAVNCQHSEQYGCRYSIERT